LSTEDKSKKKSVTLILAVAITLTVGAIATGYYVTNIYIPQVVQKTVSNETSTSINETNTNSTNQTSSINMSGINGTVTGVQELDNGTFIVSVAPSAKKEMKYQDNIIQSIKKEAGIFSNVCSVQITTKDDNESRVVYEKPNSKACEFVAVEPPVGNNTIEETQPPVVNETTPVVVPPPEPVPAPVVNETVPATINNTANNTQTESCETWTVNANNEVICTNDTTTPTPTTSPTPTPTIPAEVNTDKRVILVGDVSDNTAGNNVFNAIKSKKPDLVGVLGDLGYANDLSWFKSTYGTLNNVCSIGNHDSANEDGTAALEKEAQALCKNPFFFKLNNVLFVAINTNGNLDTQLGAAQEQVMNTKQMQGVKEVHLLTHKPCSAPPNSHHPVETDVKTFCDSFKAKIPAGVKFFNDAAHNHVMSASKDGQYKQIGAGGKSHYTCGLSTFFTFCDNAHFGYLEYIIKPDGTSTFHFYDYNGKVVE